MGDRLSFVFFGLSIRSTWGNGHATTYRGLVTELCARGHRVVFLERDLPWYAENRDLPPSLERSTAFYGSVEELEDRFAGAVREADLTVVGSYVPSGVDVGRWVQRTARGATAFYDVDTPVTLQALATDTCPYLSRCLVPRYDLYLSFTGGPTLARLERHFGSPRARPLYCSVDPERHHPEEAPLRWALGCLATYGADRQPVLERLLLEPARRLPLDRFVLAGPQYPDGIAWPRNLDRIDHVPASRHRSFYCAQRFTLNVTRADMVRAGFSPSVRLFEAAACGVPIITDAWEGLSAFFAPGSEILVASNTADAYTHLTKLSDQARRAVGRRARARVLAEHTAAHRAETLERYTREVLGARARKAAGGWA